MTPSHRFALVAAAMFLCAGAPRPWAAGPDPPDVDALLRHLDDLYRSKSSIARIEIDVTLLATASLAASPELTGVARDASERMARVTRKLKQTGGVERT